MPIARPEDVWHKYCFSRLRYCFSIAYEYLVDVLIAIIEMGIPAQHAVVGNVRFRRQDNN